ncbi:MAG: DUF1080 domain-containing protein [Patescibacteria group bacterium]|nr:DUF1080 domain-containing protein [Patescibacteria group bacterium]
MKHWNMRGKVLLALGAVLVATVALQAEETEQGFTPMFNGKDLTGWEGMPGAWKVEDGAMVSESTAENPATRTHYLYWKGGEPGDFELRCRYRVLGEGGNSGIQFRSEPRPNWDCWGYQADIDTAGVYTGCLYQHERGLVAQRGQKVVINPAGEKTITQFADAAELLKAVKVGDWNEYRIVAKGRHTALWINGVLMCEAEDHEPKYALPKGMISLQMHAGPPMRIEFKDLRIRTF